MTYTYDEIEKIVGEIGNGLIQKYIYQLNAQGRLDEFLGEIGYAPADDWKVKTSAPGKILVIGGTNVKRSDLEMAASKNGFDKNQFEWVLSYADAKKYPFRTLQYNSSYAAVLVGPMPHKCCFETECASVISEISEAPGYPPVMKLETGTKLSITKENFTKALREVRTRGLA